MVAVELIHRCENIYMFGFEGKTCFHRSTTNEKFYCKNYPLDCDVVSFRPLEKHLVNVKTCTFAEHHSWNSRLDCDILVAVAV